MSVTTTGERDKGTVAANFTVTNWVQTHALNCNGGAIATTDDVLGTVIAELIRQGILKGSVTT